jgi:hypothetical protein
MLTFRQFMAEADMAAAPAMGASPAAPGEEKSHDDLNVLGRELDISPRHLQKALTDTPILSFSPINRKGHNKGSGPQVIFPDKVNKSGSVSGKLMQGNMQKLQNPNGSRSDGPETEPIHFRPINRKDASYTFPNVWLEPFRKQQQGAGAGMGGMPPGGAGALPPPPGGI